MVDKKRDEKETDASGIREINIDDLISKNEEDAPTEVYGSEIKGLDANRYATKKTVAQGMLDIALLTSNASQLKYVLQVGPKHEFYTLLVTLISISMVLQVVTGLVLLSLNLLRDCRFHLPRHRTSSLNINYLTTAFAFVITVLNVLVSAFDSSLARYQDIYQVISTVVAMILCIILDINNTHHQRGAEILNNTTLVFKSLSIPINILITVFTVQNLDFIPVQ